MFLVRRTAEDAAQTRRILIRTALHEFAAQGWSGGSLVAIARRAGLTRGAIYHHFDSKEALLRAVLNEEWARQMPPVLSALDAGGRPSERLLTFLSTYLRLLTDDTAFRDLAVVSTIVAPQAMELTAGLEEKRHALQTWRSLLVPALTAAGPLRDGMSPEAGVFVLFTVIHGLTLTAATEPDLIPTGDDITTITRAVIYGLLPSPDDVAA